MDRRTFLCGLALGALSAPDLAQAQPTRKIPRVAGIALHTPEQIRHIIQAIELGLRDHGWIPGKNVMFEVGYAHGRLDRLPEIAAQLVRLNVDVLVTGPGPQAVAAQAATKDIPIVFGAVTDPVGQGFASSIAKPGGNMTGLTTLGVELLPKRLELLKQTAPMITSVDVLMNPTDRVHESLVREVKAAGHALNLDVRIIEARDRTETERALAAIRSHRAGLAIAEHSLFFNMREFIVDRAQKSRNPAMYPHREFVEAGGLMSYATDLVALFRRTGGFVDRILKGANPADLPIEQPTKFELLINAKTAKALGLTIPHSVLVRADELIQ